MDVRNVQPPNERVPELIAQIAGRLLENREEMLAEVHRAVLDGAAELARDPAMAAELRASTEANVLRWMSSMQLHPGEPIGGEVPPEALDAARAVVRRGGELGPLLHGYRAGQNAAWRRWMEAAAEISDDPRELVEVLDRSAVLMFGYVDRVLERMIAQIGEERDELLSGGLARRAEAVRLILDGAPIPAARASERLGYELGRRHTAVVLWAEPAGSVQGALERAATALARAAGAGRPLTLPAGTSSLWAWIGTDSDPPVATLREAMEEAEPHLRAAVGPTRAGITGFRRSHAGALATQRLVAGAEARERLTAYGDVEAVALAAADEERMTEFVAATLGPLAADTATAARLRETLRIHLREGGNAPRAARALDTHRNTILNRVARAEELLGHPVGARRLELALALELTHRLGARALRAAADPPRRPGSR